MVIMQLCIEAYPLVMRNDKGGFVMAFTKKTKKPAYKKRIPWTSEKCKINYKAITLVVTVFGSIVTLIACIISNIGKIPRVPPATIAAIDSAYSVNADEKIAAINTTSDVPSNLTIGDANLFTVNQEAALTWYKYFVNINDEIRFMPNFLHGIMLTNYNDYEIAIHSVAVNVKKYVPYDDILILEHTPGGGESIWCSGKISPRITSYPMTTYNGEPAKMVFVPSGEMIHLVLAPVSDTNGIYYYTVSVEMTIQGEKKVVEYHPEGSEWFENIIVNEFKKEKGFYLADYRDMDGMTFDTAIANSDELREYIFSNCKDPEITYQFVNTFMLEHGDYKDFWLY